MNSSHKITIREFAYPEDYPEVRHLWENAGPGIQLRQSDEAEEIEKKVRHDPDLFLVAVSDGKIVGTVIGGFDGRRGLIYHLAVTGELREEGIGSMLMQEVEQRMKNKGCIRSYLLVTRDNEYAMRFYEKLGWALMDNVFIYGKEL
jgi:ribosomal protein S18 acetylase RimI-like enzyme